MRTIYICTSQSTGACHPDLGPHLSPGPPKLQPPKNFLHRPHSHVTLFPADFPKLSIVLSCLTNKVQTANIKSLPEHLNPWQLLSPGCQASLKIWTAACPPCSHGHLRPYILLALPVQFYLPGRPPSHTYSYPALGFVYTKQSKIYLRSGAVPLGKKQAPSMKGQSHLSK